MRMHSGLDIRTNKKTDKHENCKATARGTQRIGDVNFVIGVAYGENMQGFFWGGEGAFAPH